MNTIMSNVPEQPGKKKSASAAQPDEKACEEQAAGKSPLPPVSDLHFHYNREERLAMLSASRHGSVNSAKRGLFKKNGLLLILFIAILLVSIILLFNKGVIRLPSSAAPYKQEQGGYSFVLRGLQLKDRIIASITIRKMELQTEVTGLLYVRFSGKKEAVLSSMDLPTKKDEERELTATLFEAAGNQLLKVEITLGKDIFTLSRKITNE